jgi:hypothetical protein
MELVPCHLTSHVAPRLALFVQRVADSDKEILSEDKISGVSGRRLWDTWFGF